MYRDLKPHNILLTRNPDGSFRGEVTDFGLVKKPSPKPQNLEDYSHIQPPEEYLNNVVIPEGDQFVWAAGLVIPALTGRNYINSELGFAKNSYPPIPSLNELITKREPLHEALEPVTDRALKENPQERYPSMDALVADLEERVAKVKQLPNRRTILPPFRRLGKKS